MDLNKSDVLSDFSLQVFIHELNHCLKNNWEGRVLSDSEFEIATGLNHTIFSTAHVPYDILSDTFENIEEAVNTIQEYDLFKIITGRNPVVAGTYKDIETVMRKILTNFPQLYVAIIDSEFNKDDNWIKYIGEENAINLDSIFKKDILSKENLIYYNGLFNDSEQIRNQISNRYK